MFRPSRSLAALAVSAAIPAAVFADNAADLARLRQQVDEQKAESDATIALQTADRLRRTDPAAADRVLRSAVQALDTTATLGAEKRAALARRLQAKLGGTPVAPARSTQPAAVAVPETAKSEAKEVFDGVQAVAKLYDKDQFAAAQKEITRLSAKYPNNPAVIALNAQGYVADRVAAARLSAKEQADRVLAAFRAVDTSAQPARGDVEYAKDFKARMELRDKLSGVTLSDDELATLKALETKVQTGVTNGPFQEVLQGLSDLIQVPLIIDLAALAEDNRDAKKPVTLPAGVSARTALRAVVQSQGMTYIIKEKAIHVVTVEEARKTLVKRAYYLGDVLPSPISGGVTVGPFADFQMAAQTAQQIIESIKRSIDPNVWEGQGGFASVTFHAPSQSIIVSAPAEVQFSVHQSMRRR